MPIATSMRRPARAEGGQALVELALVLPVLLLILLGIIQFGSLFRDYIALTDATRVGARQAGVARSLQPPSSRDPAIIARVQKAGVNLDPAKMTITIELRDVLGNVMPNHSLESSWVPSGDVTVRTTYPFKVKLFGVSILNGTLKSRTTERIE